MEVSPATFAKWRQVSISGRGETCLRTELEPAPFGQEVEFTVQGREVSPLGFDSTRVSNAEKPGGARAAAVGLNYSWAWC